MTIDLKHLDKTGLLHKIVNDEIAKDPSREQDYYDAMAELEAEIEQRKTELKKK